MIFWQFFTHVLVAGFSLKFEWEQITPNPPESFQYSGQSLHFCLISNCPLLSKSYCFWINHLGFVPNTPNTIGIPLTFMFQFFFLFFFVFCQGLVTYLYFRFLLISLYDLPERRNPLFCRLSHTLFFRRLSLGLVVFLRFGNLFVFQNPKEFWESHSPGHIMCCVYSSCSQSQIQFFCSTPSPFGRI